MLKMSESIRKDLKNYSQIFGKRELHFIAADYLEQVLATLSMDEERKREEDFLSLVDDVKSTIDEVTETKGLIERLENSYSQNKIGKTKYEAFREKLLGKLALAERRWNKLRITICSP